MTMDKRERVARAIAESDGHDWDACTESQRGEYLDNADAAIAALEPMDKPRVKPLVWTSKGCAETPFGNYLVVLEDWSGQDDFWFVCFAGKPYGKCGEHGSEEAAKAAAQADYEARILAALEPVTVQPVAMTEEARARIIDLAHESYRKFQRGVRGQTVTEWDGIESWVVQETIRALAQKDAGNG